MMLIHVRNYVHTDNSNLITILVITGYYILRKLNFTLIYYTYPKFRGIEILIA